MVVPLAPPGAWVCRSGAEFALGVGPLDFGLLKRYGRLSMHRVLLTVLLLLLAAPAADAKSRLLAESDGTVTIEWPDRVCTQDGIEDDLPVTFSLDEIVEIDDDATVDTPANGVDFDDVIVDDWRDEMLDWPEVPVKPWRVVYRADGSYDAWHDLTCAIGDVNVDPVDPDARTLMRAAHASHHAKVKAVREKARRRGLGQAGR